MSNDTNNTTDNVLISVQNLAKRYAKDAPNVFEKVHLSHRTLWLR